MGDFNKSRGTIFKEMLDHEEFVNATLATEDGGNFKVHFEVLFAKSPYIRKPMENANKVVSQEILIPGVSKEILEKIIHCIYTEKLNTTDDNITHLMDAAHQLGVSDILQICNSFLGGNLTVENCLGRFYAADRYRYNDLKGTVKKFIVANFEKVQKRDDFCNLDIEDLRSILSCDSLNIRDEESVYTAVMTWVEKDQNSRTVHLPSLLLCVRVGLCDYTFFNEVIWTNPLVNSNEECHVVLYQGSQLFADLRTEDGDQLLNTFDPLHPFLRPRIPNEIIFVMGGWSAGSATNAMETYDCKTRRWFLTHADNFPRAYHGMVWHEGKIYVIGGFDGQQCFNSVRCFDPISHVWEERGCMHVQRCYVSCATVGKYVYAMGGYDGHRRNRSCERYEPDTNQWTLIANMNAVRSDASADSMNGRIYIAGGFNGTQVLESAECYDPTTNEWTVINRMNSPRSGVKMVAFRSHLYVIGGFNGSNRLSTVERYDRNANAWTFVAPMLGPRSNFATGIVNDCIYAIGGFNGLSTISTAEKYDPSTNTWSPVTDLNLNRSALAACKVSNIPTAREYTFLGMYN